MKAHIEVASNDLTKPAQTIEYPILMEDVFSKMVVLFMSEHRGIVVREDDYPTPAWPVGAYLPDWSSCKDSNEWIPFVGKLTLTLENK
jgi:hypothetical protein